MFVCVKKEYVTHFCFVLWINRFFFTIFLQNPAARIKDNLCPIKFDQTAHVPEVLEGIPRKQKLFVCVKDLFLDRARMFLRFF